MTALIGFFLGPVGRFLGMGMIAVAALGWAYSKGASNERGKCEAASLRAELATVRADLEKTRRAADNAKALGQMLTDAERRNQELSDAISDKPDETPTTDGCRVSDDARRRLRDIR